MKSTVNPSFKLLPLLAIFLSAFLLFQVEPLIARLILPWFGGGAGVWTVCLLFFQVVLLLGYLYAHLLTRTLGRRAQGWVHAGLLTASLLTLPILPKDSWKPLGPEHAALHILGILGLTIGLPFFLLSSTTPLVQAWSGETGEGKSVYRLYAFSNAGSLLALLSYPTLFEPRLTTIRQVWLWSLAYAATAILSGVLALTPRGEGATVRAERAAPPPGWTTLALWAALSACSSAFLLAITHHLTQNIAAVPFLWIIPLSLYLLSFILCFEGRRWYQRPVFLRLLGVAVGGMVYALSPEFAKIPFWLSIALFCGGFFVVCMFCHGELAHSKPDPAHLTLFYFLISLGSVVGAVFVALLAPVLFSGYYELQVALAGCAALAVLTVRRNPLGLFRPGSSPLAWVPLYALAGAVIASAGFTAWEQSENCTLMVRNFYGVLRVRDERAFKVVEVQGDRGARGNSEALRRLLNGTITHGVEFLAPARRDLPTSYYGPNSGIGVALNALANRGPLRVGVVGLGAGTIAAYGRPGDFYEFYEINPLDVMVARQEFRFLEDSRAQTAIELGDARLSLERQPPQQFDALAIDAFSSDSIPVHLLTLEAFQLYFRHLRPDGVLAVHISNTYLNLQPVVAAAAERLGKEAVLITNEPDEANGISLAKWVVVGSRDTLQELGGIQKAGQRVTFRGRIKMWTDAYSSLFAVLK